LPRHHLRPPAIAVAVLGVLAVLVVALTAAALPADDSAATDDQARAAESARAESAERVDQGRAGVEADRQEALLAQRAAEEARRQAEAEEKARAEAEAQAEAAARAEAERKAAEERAARSAERAAADPKAIARELMGGHGWGGDQFSCLEQLWEKESGWDHTAQNPSSGAYGIPQALPGSKMASAGSDWQTDPATQIEWGLGYIAERYGTPCSAWGHSQSANWY
jgi:hypothetical protein